jgi:hypothetical protein
VRGAETLPSGTGPDQTERDAFGLGRLDADVLPNRLVIDRLGDAPLARRVPKLPGAQLEQDAVMPDVIIDSGGTDFVGVVGALVVPNKGTQDSHSAYVSLSGELQTVGSVQQQRDEILRDHGVGAHGGSRHLEAFGQPAGLDSTQRERGRPARVFLYASAELMVSRSTLTPW